MTSSAAWQNLAWEQVSDGLRRKVMHGMNVTLALVEVGPGVETAAHSHPHEQFSHVLAGTGTYVLGDESLTVEPGDLVHIPPDVRHGATAGAHAALLLLDVFSPRREDLPASKRT